MHSTAPYTLSLHDALPISVEPVEILDLHHRGNDAAERAVGRVQAPRHDEAPLRAIATALVRLAEEKPCVARLDRKSTRLNSSHVAISYAVFCLKKRTQSSY